LDALRITPFTRVVLTLDLVFSLLAGGVLYLLPTQTDEYFAWTIKVPLTAAFLGAGYLGAATMLVFTYGTTDWQRVRIVPVIGFTLTTVTTVVTLWHLEPFHFGEGPAFAQVAAWAWLVVYVSIPVLLATVFVRQERAGDASAYAAEEPLVPLMRGALLVQAVAATILGLGLILWSGAFDVVWPWPLTPLTAGAVGAWILTIASFSWWALREGDWTRFRTGVPGFAVFLALVVVGAFRYSEPLDSGAWQPWAFFGALAISVSVFAAATWQQEKRGQVSRRKT
jgi:hypothetical protein